jgi:hypothetical protein
MAEPKPKLTEQQRALVFDHIVKMWQTAFEEWSGWLLFAVAIAVGLGLKGLFVQNNDLAPAKGKIGICLIIVVGAFVLTAFKKRFQWIYGLGQVLAGLVSCWISMDGFAKAGVTRYQAVLFLGGSIYLLREGIETFWDGMTQKSGRKQKSGDKQPASPP